MTNLKRIISVLLAAIMLLGLCGCSVLYRCARCIVNLNEAEPQATVIPSETGEMQATEKPAGTPVPEPTDKPDERTEEQKAAEAAFWALDEELFLDQATTDITSLDQFCENPANFGIDESTVPVTLGEFTEAANDEWIEKCIAWREKLNAIDRNQLSDELQFSYDTYCRYFDMEIESKDLFYNYEPLDEGVGLHANMPLFFGMYTIRDEKDVENYLTLMADMPRYFGQVLAFEEERAERGFFMTEKQLDTILDDLQTIADSGKTSFLHDTFREAIEDKGFLTQEQKKTYIAKSDTLVNTSWVEAYQLLHDGLEKLRPKCRARTGAYEQGGAAYDYYCWKMKSEASNNRTVEEEMRFLESCFSSIYTIFLTSAMNCYNDLMSGERITTGSLSGDEAYLKTLMPKIVPPMPNAEVTYVEIAKELQEVFFSPAAYFTPALDGFYHNIILTNPLYQDRYDMFTLAHEGFPGHMYQFTYQYNLGTIPKYQLMIESNGYAESWSTNAEWNVAKINEKYGTDLSIATFLNGYLANILCTIVSLKVNGQGASLDEVKTYLNKWNLGLYAQDFYDYAIDQPIYFFKYTGGFCELFDLTNRCSNGDLVAFFTEYLHWGPGYFDLLDERMEAWANAQ